METFSAWVLSIAGICILSVLVDLMISHGQTGKYIKNIFAFFIILIIVSPIPTLFKKDFNFDFIFVSEEIGLQDNYIYQLNRDKLTELEKEIEKSIESYNIYGVKIILSADIFTSNMQIDTVFVDLFNLVINGQNSHINTNETIINCIKNKIGIKEDKIIFNERKQ